MRFDVSPTRRYDINIASNTLKPSLFLAHSDIVVISGLVARVCVVRPVVVLVVLLPVAAVLVAPLHPRPEPELRPAGDV